MRVFAISDLHLSHAVDKPMHVFGPHWEDHAARIQEAWRERVDSEDLVLVPGDLSWGMRFDDSRQDLEFLGALPGTKLIVRGNHDYWWATRKKLAEFLPPSIIPLQNTAHVQGDIGVAGTRLWIDADLKLEESSPEDRRIWERELGRLRMSLMALPQGLKHIIVMTHYPPISLEGRAGRAVALATEFGCDVWVFGHMHLGGPDYAGFNCTIGSIRFEFVSADYLDFIPKLIFDQGGSAGGS